jgi:tRNA modification GTPase
MQAHIQPLIDSFQYGNAIKQGIPVAIIGRPNAGKSSLLNLLLKEDRAIVSDIAGTTRDTIEEAIHIKGVAYRFVDTAGIRQTDDSIEQIGIEKALQKIALAEVVLYIFDVSILSEQDIQTDLNLIQSHNAKAKVLMIANKADLLKDPAQQPQYLKAFSPLIMGSTKDQTLAQAIQGALQDLVKWEQHSNVIVNNARHQQCLLAAQEALTKATDLMQAKASSDLLAFELKAAVQSIGDISGLISNDEVLGYIFGKFCIGK